MPARQRELLTAMGVSQLTVTKHPDGQLLIFPRPAWELFRDKLLTLPMEAAGWKRVFLGNATDVDIDASNRVLIAPELRLSAGLVRDVMLVGMGSHLELWDAQRHAEQELRVLQTQMPTSIANFVY